MVGLQDALKGLPIVITSQSQLFVDFTCCKVNLGGFTVVSNSLIYLMVE